MNGILIILGAIIGVPLVFVTCLCIYLVIDDLFIHTPTMTHDEFIEEINKPRICWWASEHFWYDPKTGKRWKL